MVYDQNFYWGGQGSWMGRGVAVKNAWSGVVGVIKGSFQKHLKTAGGQKQKLFVGGGGFWRYHRPYLPSKILIVHIVDSAKKGLDSIFGTFSQGGVGGILSCKYSNRDTRPNFFRFESWANPIFLDCRKFALFLGYVRVLLFLGSSKFRAVSLGIQIEHGNNFKTW